MMACGKDRLMTHEVPGTEAARWAVEVARAFDAYHRSYEWGEFTPFPIDECWVGADLALYIRYSPLGMRFGKRVPDLQDDPTGYGPTEDAATLARYIFYDLYGPPPAQWTDSRGYGWSGAPPETGSWEAAVEHQPRITTVVQGESG
jgi:hypothetical protein